MDMTPRMWAAMDAAHCKTGPNRGHLKAKCPPMGTDAAIYWQAVMWEVNPHRASLVQMACYGAEERAFFDEVVAWVKRSRAARAAA